MKQTFDLFVSESSADDERSDDLGETRVTATEHARGDEGAPLVDGVAAGGGESGPAGGHLGPEDGSFTSEPAAPLPGGETMRRRSLQPSH